MKTLISAIQSFITHFLAEVIITSGLLLVAGEIRFAALSCKISPFSERMTGMKVNDILK
jgi:hypothetical protein